MKYVTIKSHPKSQMKLLLCRLLLGNFIFLFVFDIFRAIESKSKEIVFKDNSRSEALPAIKQKPWETPGFMSRKKR